VGDIEFLYPQFFIMFAIPLLWLIYTLVTKKRVEQTIFSPEVLERLTSSSGGFSIKTRTIITLFSLLFMVIALARPVIDEGSVEVESKSVDVLFALDISKSMLASDRYPNRLEFAKKKSIDIIKGLKGNRVGVVAFANNGYTVAPLTFDRDGVEYLIKNIDSQNISEQGTSIERLLYSVDSFLKDNPDRVLILFTDGGDVPNYDNEIALAKKMKLRIFVVGVASESGAPIKLRDGSLLKDRDGNIVITKFNSAIKDLALETGGIFMNGVNSDDDVKAILQEIEKIDSTEVKKDKLPIYLELFIYPLTISLILLFPIFYSLPKMPRLRKLWLIPISILYFSNQPSLEAGLLDWWYIDKANESFKSGDYSKTIENLSQVESSDEVKFDIANSYYRAGKYDKAIENYRKVEGSLKREALYNMGNAYVQKNQLEKAKISYEKSLEIEENPKARENLEWVKNRLRQKKRKEQEKKDQQQKNGDQKDQQQKNGDQKDQQQKNGDQKDQQQKNGDQKDQQQKNSDQKDNNSTKSDRVIRVSEDNLTEERDVNMSQISLPSQKELKEREKMKDMKIFDMLNRLKGGTKVYSIPLSNMPERRDENVKPW